MSVCLSVRCGPEVAEEEPCLSTPCPLVHPRPLSQAIFFSILYVYFKSELVYLYKIFKKSKMKKKIGWVGWVGMPVGKAIQGRVFLFTEGFSQNNGIKENGLS